MVGTTQSGVNSGGIQAMASTYYTRLSYALYVLKENEIDHGKKNGIEDVTKDDEENLKWSCYTESDNTDVFTNRHANKTIPNTQDPERNFNVDIPVDGEGPGIVNVNVLDREKFGKDKSSGSIQIAVADIVGTTHNRVNARSDKKDEEGTKFQGKEKEKENIEVDKGNFKKEDQQNEIKSKVEEEEAKKDKETKLKPKHKEKIIG